LKKEYEDWWSISVDVIRALSVGVSAEKESRMSQLMVEIAATYHKCHAWAAVNPASLEHRTKELIDDPRLPGPVLTSPVDDDALWSQWEFAQAEKRKESMRKAEEARSRAAQKARLAEVYDHYWRDRLRSPVIFIPFPGGGGVAAERR